MKGWLAAALALLPAPVAADGPALAHLTVGAQTVTLTADDSLPAPRMLRRDGDVMHLHFAQLHLGFPLPPQLTLSLQQTENTWTLTSFTLERSDAQPPLAVGTETLRLTQNGAAGPETFVITGEAMAPGGALVPLRVEITLRSP
ncbi:hypothetical protein [Gymnodinialimonas ulvae]|uniref:hypothetical protein n=1 Tax=Gymnodinialimonas ulvae TaxID=3126504 RepID=UPI0030AC2C39